MSHCVCLSPTIIRNRDVSYFTRDIVAVRCLDVFHRLSFHELMIFNNCWSHLYGLVVPSISKIKREGLDFNDYAFITRSGDEIPAFIAVPCGKCVVCRGRVVNDWVTRCVCESSEHLALPYFVTLTYNNYHLPSTGVCKSDVQKFFKRLRVRIGSFRYLLCSEYGKNSHRPHYHFIIWSDYFKGLDNIAVLNIIERAWSLYDYQNGFYDSFGFCYVRPCDMGAVRYVSKYMYKDGFLPYGMEATFFLSSRRPAIGRTWLDKNTVLYRSNVKLLDLKVLDRFSGSVYSAALPRYYSSLLFPSFSRRFGKCYDVFKFVRSYLSLYDVPKFRDDLVTRFPDLFKFLPNYDVLRCRLCAPSGLFPYSDSGVHSVTELSDLFKSFVSSFDYNNFCYLTKLCNDRKKYLAERELFSPLPDGYVSAKASSIISRRRRSRLREIL